MDERKLRSIQNITLLALFIVLLLAGGFVWGEFKRASGISKPDNSASMAGDNKVKAEYIAGATPSGKTLFRQNCQRCHLLDKRMTGPALMNVKDRWSDTTHIYAWVKNSQAYLESGDPYAKDLYKQYNSIMPAFPNLSDTEIADILYYIDPVVGK